MKHTPKKALKTTKPLKIGYDVSISVSDHTYALVIRRRIKKCCGYDMKVKKMAR